MISRYNTAVFIAVIVVAILVNIIIASSWYQSLILALS